MRQDPCATRQSSEKLVSIAKRKKINSFAYMGRVLVLAAAFRDTQLFNIFESTFETLTELMRRTIPFDHREYECSFT